MHNMINPCDLTPEQKEQWEHTMTLLGWKAPGFRHIFYRMLTKSNGKYFCLFTKDIPTAATDGHNVLANPDFIFSLTLQERVFVMAHEICHNMLNDVMFLHHCTISGKVPMSDGTTLPFHNKTMQKSMDYRINPLLADSGIGKQPAVALNDPSIARANDMLVDVYRKVYEDEEANGGDHGLPGGFDMVLKPGTSTGTDPATAASQHSPQQWAVEIAQANKLEELRTQGRGMGALQRMFQQLLNPQVPWQDLVRSVVTRVAGSGGYNWRKPDRRFIVRDIHMPSRSGFGAGWIVIWGDTSGSIAPNELEHFLAEQQDILYSCNPRRVSIVWCDDGIQRIDEVHDAGDMETIRATGVGGGGGTSMIPVLDWVRDQHDRPDMFIGMTDGEVTFPDVPPPYECLWMDVSGRKDNYPFGTVVHVNTKGEN